MTSKHTLLAVEVARIFLTQKYLFFKKRSILSHLVKEKSVLCILKELVILAL